jgi:hypothetical protein
MSQPERDIETSVAELAPDVARAYVKRWIESGRALEQFRWSELADLDDARALRATEALLDYGATLPLTRTRLEWSGLVEQQRLFRQLVRR